MRKLIAFVIFATCVMMLPWLIISTSTTKQVYTDINELPAKKYGLLLGTTPGPGANNPFFVTRIEATKELYERGKIEYILVSGDNANQQYNEPQYMKNALMRAGIPENVIRLDYAGFRTLDSVIRAKEIFSIQDNLIIISQPFHIERALFLAKKHGINAIGYGAADVSLEKGWNTYVREIGARWIALYDVWFGTEATVLGEKVEMAPTP